jgi:hypothetical protein
VLFNHPSRIVSPANVPRKRKMPEDDLAVDSTKKMRTQFGRMDISG